MLNIYILFNLSLIRIELLLLFNDLYETRKGLLNHII